MTSIKRNFCALLLSLLAFLQPLLSFSDEGFWYPQLPENVSLPGFFRVANGPQLSKLFLDSLTDEAASGYPKVAGLINRLQWTAVTLLRTTDPQGQQSAWLILAGTAPKDAGDYSNSAFTKQAGAVVGCQLRVNPTAPSNFQFSPCRLFSVDSGSEAFNHTDVGLLGTGLRSAELPSGEGGVLAYCDPLWHISSGSFSPSGRCTLRFLKQGAWQDATSTGLNVDFCSAAGHTQPCGGGFSVDLRANGGDGAERVHLLAGLPLTQPHGRARILNTILSTSSASNPSYVMHDIHGAQEHFGSSVAWASCVGQASGLTAVVSSPSVVQGSPSVYGYTLQDDEGIGSAAYKFSPKDVLEGTGAEAEFGGFGLVVETVSLPSPGGSAAHVSHFAVIIGAPYERVPSVGTNAGRVYMYCQTDGNRTALSGLHTLAGSRAGEQFGYTVSRIADVDGDGVEDIAIGAPALGEAPGIFGRVYIYRLLPTCEFEAKPFQILEAPSPSAVADASTAASRGFGVSISRGVDIDRDGGPELVVTSLDPATPFHLFSMPRRLFARCQVSLQPKMIAQSAAPGAKLKATFVVRLLDPTSRAFVPLPKNFLSVSSGRTHQINPDVFWQEHISQVKQLSEQGGSNTSAIVEAFFASNMGGGGAQMENLEARLELDDAPIIATAAGNGAMRVQVGLRTRISGEQMKLDRIPLRIAYRYPLSDPRCSSYSVEGGNCGKSEQPLVDWSACSYTFPVVQPICAPFPRCEADLSAVGKWVDVAAQNSSSSTATNDGNVTLVKISYGVAGIFNRKLQLTIRNNGPTKSSDVRIELRALGWPQNDTTSGIRGKFVSIKLKNPRTGALLAVYGAEDGRSSPSARGRPSRYRWSISVSSNEAAALITSKADTWLYADEEVLLEVGLFLSGMQRGQLPSDAATAQGNLPSPGIQANVSCSSDAQPSNNVATVLYQIVYKPNIVIGAGEAVPTLVDDRKKAPKLRAGSARKVFAHELGPRLEHVFLIENTGSPEIQNATLQLDIPVSTSGGDLFVYLSDKVRRKADEHSSLEWVSTLPRVVSADGRVAGTCTMDSSFVNPLNITVMDIPLEGPVEISRRSRRSVDAVEAPPVTPPTDEDNTVTRAYFKRSCQRQVLIRCPSFSASPSPTGPENKGISGVEKTQKIGDCATVTASDIKVTCARVVCHLNKMAPSATVRLHVSGWLLASTFFKHHLPDVKFVTKLSLVNWGDLPPSVSAYANLSDSGEGKVGPGGSAAVLLDFPSPAPTYEMAQSVVFRNVSPRRLARMPLWPILTGIVVGSIILVTVISLLYYCGFFNRRKRTRAARRRAELTASYRRSTIAAAGAGAGGAGGFAGPAANKPDFLLPPEKNSTQARNGHHRSEKEKGLYAAVPMVEGSADLVYAVSPEPPSPCAPEKEEFEPEASVHRETGAFVSSTDQLLHHSPAAGEHVNTAHSASDLDTVEQLDDDGVESSIEALPTTDRPTDGTEKVAESAVTDESSKPPSADSANTSGATQDEQLPEWLVGELEESKKRAEAVKPTSSD